MLSAAPKIPDMATLPVPSRTVLATLKKWGDMFYVPLPWLVTASYIESGHNPTKVNRSPTAARKGNAWGLLQQMGDEAKYKTDLIRKFYTKPHPTTAGAWRGTRADMTAVKNVLARYKGRASDLLDIDLNTLLAAWQFGRLIRVFGRDFSTVMAAYHQGENAVKRRIAAGEMPVDPGVQPVGYEYVSRALAARDQYERRYL